MFVADRNIHFLEDEGINKSNENELNKENGLSKCDTVNDIQLDRNIFYIPNDSTSTENIEGRSSFSPIHEINTKWSVVHVNKMC